MVRFALLSGTLPSEARCRDVMPWELHADGNDATAYSPLFLSSMSYATPQSGAMSPLRMYRWMVE